MGVRCFRLCRSRGLCALLLFRVLSSIFGPALRLRPACLAPSLASAARGRSHVRRKSASSGDWAGRSDQQWNSPTSLKNQGREPRRAIHKCICGRINRTRQTCNRPAAGDLSGMQMVHLGGKRKAAQQGKVRLFTKYRNHKVCDYSVWKVHGEAGQHGAQKEKGSASQGRRRGEVATLWPVWPGLARFVSFLRKVGTCSFFESVAVETRRERDGTTQRGGSVSSSVIFLFILFS